ncbi:DUF7683 domain-containing protein [Lysinibacillus tabacifolii]|uniref:DUF7683 domain-containing protein n=1 Tax=Lysinibacillus tabacifolii TaxID=1173107 RepID=UPI00187D507D|nr:hypothetical protein [Lysinibacillus tabacifolii]
MNKTGVFVQFMIKEEVIKVNNHIKYQWRITKYNPDFRNNEGHYTKKLEWTSPAHIGKTINGETFTLEKYLKVETAYINTIMKFLEVNHIKSLTMINMTYIDVDSNCALYNQLYDEKLDNFQLKDDQEVSIDQIPLISKMVLRGFIYCHFITLDFFVHFGDDYYMFIGTNNYQEEPLQFARENNLFVEEMVSPFYINEENIERMIMWTPINEDTVVGEEILTDFSIEEYREILHLSNIHPVIGLFPITASNQQFFQKKLRHKIDTNKYQYYLSAGD